MLSITDKELFKSLPFILKGNITMLACNHKYVNIYKDLFEFLYNNNVNIFSFTSNSKEQIKENLGVRVNGMYTDLILPSDIE